ncbi:MAG: cobalamin-binding protein [Candidatus Omnitrophica bacterium]|nr:cobalamin-binding protein [Candidatus Omnitrophota bacterium]
MKICSLLPTATEVLFALGLGDEVVGVTHECDYPPEAKQKRRVVRTVIAQDRMSSDEIDRTVRAALRSGDSLYQVDVDALRELAPDLIVTQELCEVCAIDTGHVLRALSTLPSKPEILSLHPHTLSDSFRDIRLIGAQTGRGQEADDLVRRLQDRMTRVQDLVAELPRPRVICMEWLRPLMACGHWVPEQVELAGGQEVVSRAGEQSHVVEWPQIREADPDALILMPCGFSIARTRQELPLLTSLPGWEALRAVTSRNAWLVNGPAYFNQSGPRLVDGIDVLAGLLHPDRAGHLVPPGAAEPL